MKTSKGNTLYKIITTLTLALPLPIYMFLSATLFNISYDATIYADDTTNLQIVSMVEDEQDVHYILSDDPTIAFDGLVVYLPSESQYALQVGNDDIIKVGSDYVAIAKNEANVFVLQDIKKFAIQEKQKLNLPIAFFVSVLGVLIVFLVVSGKMKWYRTYPRLSAFVGLLTGSVVLFLIDTIVGSLFNVFMVATLSWGIYCIEYLVAQGKINEATAKKTESELTNALRRALKGG